MVQKNIELAVHLRGSEQLKNLDRLGDDFRLWFNQQNLKSDEWLWPISPSITRIYVGDEFCIHRLPGLTDLEDILNSVLDHRQNLTLLTPPMTDTGFDKNDPLFDYLDHHPSETEVVVNDWGVLVMLKKKYKDLKISAGRLLNKAFKDPRFIAPSNSAVSSEIAELLNSSTFDQRPIKEMMEAFDLNRQERDLLPYSDYVLSTGGKTSIYLPFGYITTGRVCGLASMDRNTNSKFVPLDLCPGSCCKTWLELDHPDNNFKLILDGNTVFYQYTSAMVSSLLAQAGESDVRLVYQGLSIGYQ